MAVRYPIPQGLSDTWDASRKKLIELIGNIFDPKQNAVPPEFKGFEAQRPTGIPGMIAGGIMPETPKEAYASGMIGPMPLEIAANYRSPEMIQALRRAMAQENRARGAMAQSGVKQNTAYQLDPSYDTWTPSAIKWPVESSLLEGQTPDPLDQILRGSWFHGMRDEARNVVINRGQTKGNPALAANNYAEYPLTAVNEYGLPASTHATPSYTRFGEPYGVSITASPSIAKNFSADDYIHRVQPLYGGPPSERIIPMWRPEGQKAMNEGYNVAFNEFLDTPLKGTPHDLYGGAYNDIKHVFADYLNYVDDYKGIPGIEQDFLKTMNTSNPLTGKFNTLYSKALQDKGYRGILYSPQRYGEYEMLMLDPSYVRPLDYRKVGEYGTAYVPPGIPDWQQEMMKAIELKKGNRMMTPGAAKGYAAAEPEFATGATRLSDVFSQQPWVDRINDENKKRILEMIDSSYREQVGNQLFRR